MKRREALKWVGAGMAGALASSSRLSSIAANTLGSSARLSSQALSALLGPQSAPRDWASRIDALPRPAAGEIVVTAVGDMIISSPAAGRPGPTVQQMYRIQREADASFGNCEEPVASVGFMYQKTSQMAWPPILDDFKAAGFNMLSVANNHYIDLGQEGMLQGLDESRKRGFAVAGAGKNLEDAITPGVRTVKGVRIGLLAFWCNQGNQGGYVEYAKAGKDKSGVAEIGGVDVVVPGTDSTKALSLPQSSDMKTLADAVSRARSQVDFLMVSFHQHWGLGGGGFPPQQGQEGVIIPANLNNPVNHVAEGRMIICRAAIDAGADVVIGHGPHVLNGVEVYRGKPILYSLGHFYMEITHDGKALPQFGFEPGMVHSVETNWFLEEHRWAAIARMIVRGGRVTRLDILPVTMDVQKDGYPSLPNETDERKITTAMQEMSKPFNTELRPQDWYSEVLGL